MTEKFSTLAQCVFWIASIAGLVLSAMSVLNICTSACSDVSLYRIFGLNFGWFGLVFFSCLILSLGLHYRFTLAGTIFTLLVFAATGAELRFIWLQKYVIGQWCPLCLFIAGTVFSAFAFALFENWKKLRKGDEKMKSFAKFTVILVAAVALGWSGAAIGVEKKVIVQESDYYLGKTNSETIIYFVNDWFCPACRRVEPVVEKIYPKIAEVAKVSFVDIPVHPETSNFTPYNLQFLEHEKAKYMQLHRALSELSKKTKTPSPEDVQAAIAPYGVKLRPMNYAEIHAGMNWNEEIFRTFEIRATPTVVVANSKTGRHEKLVGENEISYEAILKAMGEVSR